MKTRRKVCFIIVTAVILSTLPSTRSNAQIAIYDIIKQGIKKVIVAVDLKIQRLQNETIWLQNAQKTLENQMSKLKLTEISSWVEKQRKLYDDYFQELWKVKSTLSYYHKVKDIIARQIEMVNEYRSAWAVFRQDKNFTAEEVEYMQIIYSGLLKESLKSVDKLLLIINSFATQMTDAKRLEFIEVVSAEIDRSFFDLKEFNIQNRMISIQRATLKGEIDYVKKLYGL